MPKNFQYLAPIFFSTLTGCSLLQRHPDSGYASPRQPKEEVIVLHSTNTMTNGDIKVHIKRLENAISTPRELEQYSKALPYFTSDSEKLAFLKLADFEERQAFLQSNEFPRRAKQLSKDLAEIIEAQDIALGMSTDLVRKSWGEPSNVDISGNSRFKNERWIYHKYISTPDGYKSEKKIVFFEGGKVVGWEVE